MEKPIESYRNDILEELFVEILQNSEEHNLNVVDILVSFMNNRMLQCERNDVVEMLKNEEE